MGKRIQSWHIFYCNIVVAVVLCVAAALYIGNEVVELPGTFH